MKKLMASALAAAMVVSLAGCGASSTATSGSGSAAATSENAATASTESVLNTDTSTLYINLASEPDRLDPALNSTVDGAVLAVNSFVGLLTYDENGQLIPGVAESYDVSEDGMTYTFHLRESKWSDGTELTAKDFVYSWNRAANPMTASDYSYLFDGLIAKNEIAEEMVANPEYDAAAAEAAAAAGEEYSTPAEVYSDAALAEQEANNILVGVEATDDYTLTVTLVSPCPYFLSLCAFPTFFPVPQASVEAANTDGTNPGAWALEAGFVSNGPYTCTAWNHDESMTYTKNPNYYDADSVSIETLQFMLSADDTAIYNAYMAGNLDFIDTIPNEEIPNHNGTDPEFYIATNIGTYYVGFNVNSKLFEGKTPEQASAMREAINLLIDRQYIVDTIGQTGQELANTFVPAGMSDSNGAEFRQNTDSYTYPDAEAVGYFDPSEDAYDENLQTAISLLESAGYEFDDNGMLSSSTPLSFTYLTNEGAGNEAIGAAIQQDMAAVGITVDVETQSWNVFLNERKAGNYDVCRQGWLADFDDPINMLEMWTTESGNNDAQFGRPDETGSVPSYAPQNWDTYNDLIASIKAETDLTKRVGLMHQAEDMLMETWAVVPLYYYNDPYMQKSNVEGVYTNSFGYKYFHHATKTAA
ncbi:peptide ABC transporter substrate-binding protein [Gemmiger formicilis]|uniref:peptide ABC transporter substrate-binding protein n=1 Tax=Gemmiger formicilis TaxID=745368 RepID=UPI001FAFD523|nr:peptide ABC transporter substrate-binding protein [Gemmiger formicilis]